MSFSVPVFLHLDSWSLRYCAAVIGVTFTCLLFLVISHPVCQLYLYDLALWLRSPFSSMVPWVHSPPSYL